MPATAPVVLNFLQKIVSRMVGTFAFAATAKASATTKATLRPWANRTRIIDPTDIATNV